MRVTCDSQITDDHVPKQKNVIGLWNGNCEVFLNVHCINFVLHIVRKFHNNKTINMGQNTWC